MSSLVGDMPGPVRSPHQVAIEQLYECCFGGRKPLLAHQVALSYLSAQTLCTSCSKLKP